MAFSVEQPEDITDTAAIITLTATTDATSVDSYVIDNEPVSGQFEVTSAGIVSLANGQSLDREQASEIVIQIK